ncbi:MAG: VanW family protein [Patescibacteria group bacterium]
MDTLEYIATKIDTIEFPKRKALSSRYPQLKGPILALKRAYYSLGYSLGTASANKHSDRFFPAIIARGSSVLMRKLGDSDLELQKQKITNLKLAAEKLNGLIIEPGATFSFWNTLGNPSLKNGYVEGMLLSEGKVVRGVGGGLCQMSNLLFWMFLHAPVEIVERFHHSRDSFPDSGRTLPFGSGATVFYNLIDLKIKNTSDQPIQLKIWLTDTQLKGQILAPMPEKQKFHIHEKDHSFIKKGEKYYRYNELWRDVLVKGTLIESKKIYTNFAPIMYEVDEKYITERNIQLIDLDLENKKENKNNLEENKSIGYPHLITVGT